MPEKHRQSVILDCVGKTLGLARGMDCQQFTPAMRKTNPIYHKGFLGIDLCQVGYQGSSGVCRR